MADPDSLAGQPAVRRLAGLPRPWADDDYPMWESLEYVAVAVGEQRTDIGADVREVGGFFARQDPNPDDVDWARLSPAEQARHYPRLTALF
ncbi:hypothetical protein Aab01nite_77510 [Paractinoplanes abujensis]|uniref:Uncharacterized protein n=1 Tax=Paractinoplanes abujensis TaxID=882441 RepID=A0A7W7CSX0_9ACTN|nr:hypothetical protein [Actinoplanes abujensis]MBB4692361.1 hypothetical protein [Actinoplanes abujensis]GID24161.1 hypothetical protein Aab01nite_77510 [Actinoplanes abujensis]